ncbi:MAG: PxKF domain-containing protein [Gemmatimonadetes bacterium]|nr:PxKF domain-containing protein [Gemmatimonadota bacterium]
MRKRSLLTLAALALAAACSESTRTPTELTEAPTQAPQKPRFDDIPNDLDESVDAMAEVMPLVVGGPSGTTTLSVVTRNDDGKPGCNLTGHTTLVVSVTSSDESVATVSPSSITFESCGDEKILTVTPVGVGSATISLSQISNSTSGTFDLTPATFTVNVTAPSPVNTPPQVAITGVTNGASYAKGSVPVAMCQVTDAEDGNSSFPATLSAITGPYAADGIGSQQASCSYTDGGGLTAASSVTYSIIDPTAPTISYVLTPPSPDGDNGWYKSDVTLTWTVTDAESPNSLEKVDCIDQNITADQQETTYSCSATSAGGSTGPVTVTIKRDAAAPTINGSASPAANGHGWNNSDVTVSFTCDDATSGVASCASPQTLSAEGAGQSVSGTARDSAGNTADATVSGINIDKTAPTVSLVGGPADGASYYFGSVPATPTCSASDALSGLDGNCTVSGYGTSVGGHTVTASAVDNAGNTGSASASYTVLAWTLKGFFPPVKMDALNTVKAGSTVPLKFQVFAGPTELTSTTVVQSFQVLNAECDASVAEGPVDITTTGGTTLRYDPTAGQFVQNWQTAKAAAGKCFKVVLTTQDGSQLSAVFKLK